MKNLIHEYKSDVTSYSFKEITKRKETRQELLIYIESKQKKCKNNIQ
jgi:hypothetical protein